MLDFFIHLDHQLFYFINTTLSYKWLDLFFPIWTNIQKNILFSLFFVTAISVYVYRHSKIKGCIHLFISLMLVGVVDQLAHAIKPFFSRSRPFESSLSFDVIVRGYQQGGFSFPSGHATDAFFLSLLLSLFFPHLKYILLVFAFLTAYSRVYCGVHFPLDVISGALLGSFLAFCCYKLIMHLDYKWFKGR